jgi:menaquinone-9 beta-reductase
MMQVGAVACPSALNRPRYASIMRLNYDVLIVGGGPAGSATALALRAYAPHLNVAIVDRAKFPRDKACGDGLGPGVREVLTKLDALSVVADTFSPPAVRVGGPDGWEGYAEGPTVRGQDLSGWVVPRLILDDRLLRLAESRGVDVFEDHQFIASTMGSNARTAQIRSGTSTQLIEARIVVGADGAYSKARTDFGAPKQPRKGTHIAMRSYATLEVDPGDPRTSSMRIDFEEELIPAYGWVFPISETRANIGVGLPLASFQEKKIDLHHLLDQYIAKLQERGIRVLDYEDTRSHLLPHAGSMPSLAYARGALVGDAASMINPLSGEGISYGMAAGNMLGESLRSFESNDDPSPYLRDYARKFMNHYRLHFLSCLTGHKLLGSAAWTRIVLKATARDQSVMDDAAFLLFNDGIITPSTGVRILRSGL